ncbi:DUF3348 family protein [Accumulibacter sp.]|uniref:DUF3348 family protein n=1 Tax=Accumulibacter sp. TaxID=2053492 RepID=UPI0025EA0EA5|nr:DUF3348 family protein [Accumulibacter sp.]MCM8611140.1 DUF3348 domain-containing protein [Accumulibacter sp.]MCM8636254.1 DUF3348 domain-containing protein [Accumulibacter sp.]MCM8638465.1 DUF3348 domain-containing protein [Accumulibacter sp.]
MSQALPRTDFTGSGLIRLLAGLSLVESAGSRQFPAEELGRWLDVADAITLHAAQGAGAAVVPAARQGPPPVSGAAVAGEFARVRATLLDLIVASCSPDGNGSRIRLPLPGAGVVPENAAAYGPFRRFHLALQSEMETGIRALRGGIRQALAAASAGLGRLAALDEACERVLAVRERQLLATTLPALLEKRFQNLLAAHRQTLDDSGQGDDPALWMQPGGWLAAFRDELRALLIAELDLRLQPVLGLVEALRNEAGSQR